MRSILTIALKEIHENLISLRFLLLLVLALVLIPASMYTNYRSYLTRVAEHRQIEERSRERLRKLKPVQVFTDANFSVDVYWPPSPASVFASGFEEEHPRHLLIGKHSVEYGAPLGEKQAPAIFGSIDLLFVVEFLFSLFAVLLSFDAITRERESGTLRSMLSNPVRRAALAGGKLIGGYATLAIPLLVSFGAGMLALSAAGLDVFASDFLARSGVMLGGALLYILVFFLIGLLVSAMSGSTYSALVVSLAIWLIAVLVVPRAASLGAQMLRPVKSRQAAWLEKQAVVASVEAERGRAVEEFVKRLSKAEREGNNWGQQRNAVAKPYEERQDQALASIDEDYQRRRGDQRRLGLTLARLSPAGALVNFATGIAQTGVRVEDRFLHEARRYRESLDRELFSKIFRDVYPSGGVSMGLTGAIRPAALPEFRMVHAGIGESFEPADIAILLGWFLTISIGIFIALEKCDVR